MPRRKHNDLAIPERIARRIRQSRIQHGMTQQALAEAVNAAVETVSRWESGKLSPSLPMLYKLAKVLNVEVEALVGKGPSGLSSKETEVIESWRRLDSEGQRWLLGLLRWISGGGLRSSIREVASQTRPFHP